MEWWRTHGADLRELAELSHELGEVLPEFQEMPHLRPDLEPYFFGYMRLKRRASSFSGIITWPDIVSFVDTVAPWLEFDLFVEVVSLLEPLDVELSERKRAAERSWQESANRRR